MLYGILSPKLNSLQQSIGHVTMIIFGNNWNWKHYISYTVLHAGTLSGY